MRDFLSLFIFCVSLSCAVQAQTDSISRLSMLFVGDIMGHGDQIKSAEISKGVYDYTPCFEWVAPLLQDADLAIGNLELTLPGKPPYSGYPQFKSPDELAIALRDAGFDILVTANNHSNDAKGAGVISTINTLEQYGFYQTGTFRNQQEKDAYYPLIVYRGNFKFVLLNYTYGTNGIPTEAPTVVNLIAPDSIQRDIQLARVFQPDAVIVVLHWGDEYQLIENEAQRQLAQNIADWGADLIIGAHPHVVQPIKILQAQRDSLVQDVPVAFSLGNFISNQKQPHTDGGLMVEVVWTKPVHGGKAVPTLQYLPVWRYIEEKDGRKTYRVVPVAAFESNPEAYPLPEIQQAALQRFAKNVRERLNAAGAVEKISTY